MIRDPSDGSVKGCSHPTLRFHSGGYYVECKECQALWVAIKSMVADEAFDHSRAGGGLFAHDERVKPKTITVRPPHRITIEDEP